MGELRRRACRLALLLLVTATHPGAAQDAKARAVPLDSLERRARADSNDAVAHYDLAMGYWRAKRWDDADHALHDAVALAPQYAEAYLALSALPIARGKGYWKKLEKERGKEGVVSEVQTGERYYRRAFLVNPLVDLGILGHVDERSSVRQGSYIITVWWLGPLSKEMNRLANGRYDEAHALCSAALADARAGAQGRNLPEGLLWYHGLAAAHLKLYDEAVQDFAILTGRALADSAGDALGQTPLRANDYRYALATALYLAGRYDEAAPTFRRALEFDISLYAAHVQLARIAEARQDWDQAVRERQAAIDANPEDPGLVTDLGVTLFREGRLEDAADALNKAMASAPRDARVPYLSGIVALRLNRRDDARAAFDRFLAIAPSRFGPEIAEVRDQLRTLEAAP